MWVVVLTSLIVYAQDSRQPRPKEKKSQEGETVVVPLEPKPGFPPPGSVIVIPKEEIQKQAGLTHDLGRILDRVVPGLAPATESASNGGQTLRGQVVNILIDGAPQSAPLRNGQRDLKIIDPMAVERVEIWTLPTSLYGYGATVSVINFVTKRTGDGAPRFVSEAGAGISLSHPEESVRGRVAQHVSGKAGDWGYALSGSWETVDGFFDGEGHRISPSPHTQGGLSDSRAFDVLGKVSYELDSRQRLELGVNYFNIDQDTEYTTVAGPLGVKTKAVKGPVPGEHPGTENLAVNLGYRHSDLEGQRVEAHAFYQEYRTRFAYSPFFPGGGQSFIESIKAGARVLVDSPLVFLGEGIRLGWGTDFHNDRTAQPLEDGRDYAPFMDQDRAGIFMQLEAPLNELLTLRGGVRQEFISVEVDGYRTLFGGNFVQGGNLYFNPTLWNAGLDFRIDSITCFAGFAQGFSLADIGLALQTTTAPSVRAFNPDGQRMDSIEFGVRGRWERVRGSVTFFYSETDDGITLGPPPAFAPMRLPERTYGVEVSLEAVPHPDWTFGVSWLWMEGEFDRDGDGDVDTYLPGYRVPPMKVLAFFEHQTLPGWSNRIQMIHVADRDRFGGGSLNFGEGEVESYTLVSIQTSIDVCEGTLTVSLDNAFNTMYFPILSQVSNVGRFYTAGEGAVLRISYSKTW